MVNKIIVMVFYTCVQVVCCVLCNPPFFSFLPLCLKQSLVCAIHFSELCISNRTMPRRYVAGVFCATSENTYIKYGGQNWGVGLVLSCHERTS